MKKHKRLIAQVIFVIACAVLWQCCAKQRGIMGFPPLDAILSRLADCLTNPQRPILKYMGHSLISIFKGLGIGIVLAFLFSGLSVVSETFSAVYNLIVSVLICCPALRFFPF